MRKIKINRDSSKIIKIIEKNKVVKALKKGLN
jgi:hypothetical protein